MTPLIPIQGVALTFNVTLHMFQTLIPLYMYQIGIPPAVLGALIAFPSLFQTFMRVPAGMAADRWGEKTVLLVSSGSMFVASLLFLPRALPLIIIAQAFTGISRCCFHPAAQSYLTKVPYLALGSRLGLYNSMTGLGSVIGPLLAGFSIARLGFQGAFMIFSASAVVCIVSVAVLPRVGVSGAKKQPESMIKGLSALVRVRPVMLAAGGRYAAALPMALMGSFFPVYLRQVGMTPERVGLITGMRGFSMMFASLLFAWLYSKMSKTSVWVVGMIGTGVAVLMIPSFATFWPLVFCTALIGFSSSPLQILPIDMVTENTPSNRRGMGIAVIGTMWGASLFLTPLIFGVLAQLTSVEVCFWAAAMPLLAMGLLTGPLFRWAYAGRQTPSGATAEAAEQGRTVAGQ